MFDRTGNILYHCIVATLYRIKVIHYKNMNDTGIHQENAPASGRTKKRKMVKSMQYRLLSLICFVLIIGLWCAASYGHLVQEVFLPSPTAVLSRLFSMAADGSLWAHCSASIARVMIGWIWSVIVAVPMGMLMASSKRFCAFIQPIIEFARYLPVVALVPLTLLYLGIEESQKYTIIFLGTFF